MRVYKCVCDWVCTCLWVCMWVYKCVRYVRISECVCECECIIQYRSLIGCYCCWYCYCRHCYCINNTVPCPALLECVAHTTVSAAHTPLQCALWHLFWCNKWMHLYYTYTQIWIRISFIYDTPGQCPLLHRQRATVGPFELGAGAVLSLYLYVNKPFTSVIFDIEIWFVFAI